MVEWVVADLGAFSLKQGKGFEGARLVEVAAVVADAVQGQVLGAFDDQAVALQDELGGA